MCNARLTFRAFIQMRGLTALDEIKLPNIALGALLFYLANNLSEFYVKLVIYIFW